MSEPEDPVREAHHEESDLEGLRDHPGWVVYRSRLIGRISSIFEDFLTSGHDRLPELQGAGRALWDQLREVDGSEARRVTLEREIQRRHEAAVEEERSRIDMATLPSRTRLWQGPRRPGVPLG